jgi:very-short-patch-repair endonuclease
MRHTPVATEKLFWSMIRDRKLEGFKFKRQFLIDPYIVDYVCLGKGLIVELDGSSHDNQLEYDEVRDVFLRRKGYRVLRFLNVEVSEDLGRVLETILQALKAPSP